MSKVYCEDCQHLDDADEYYRNFGDHTICWYKPTIVERDEWHSHVVERKYPLCQDRNRNNDCPYWTKRTTSSFWPDPKAEPEKRSWLSRWWSGLQEEELP